MAPFLCNYVQLHLRESNNPVRTKMAEIICLKEMCLTQISVQIYHNTFNHNVMIAVPKLEKDIYHLFRVSSVGCKEYHKEVERIVNEVHKITLPKCVKLQISLAVIDLTYELVEWRGMLISLFDLSDKKNQSEVVFTIFNKTLFKASGIDRANTIVRILFDTLRDLDINFNEFRKFCDLSLVTVLNYAQKYNITDTILIETVCSVVEQCSVTDAWYNPQNVVYLVSNSCRGNIDVINYFYNHQNEDGKQRWLTYILFDMLKDCRTYDNDSSCDSKKIKYIYERINSEDWNKVIKLYGNNVVTSFICTSNTDYLIMFYRQVCDYAPEHCDDILQQIVSTIVSFESNVMEQVYKEQILRTWYCTPSNIKNKFATHNRTLLTQLTDTDLINSLIKDEGLTEENRKDLVNYLFLHYKCYEGDLYNILLENVSKEFHHYIDFKVVVILALIHIPNFKLNKDSRLFKCECLVDLKKEFTKNDKCITKAIAHILKLSKIPLSNMESLFNWCFTNDEEMLKFFREKLIYEDEFIDVYQLYLDQEVIQSDNILKKIISDETVAEAMKEMIKKKYFVTKSVELLFSRKAIKYCFNNILSDTDKCQAVRSYILSEDGMKVIFQRFIHGKETKILYYRDVFNYLDSIACFVKYWVDPFHLAQDLTSFMLGNGYNFYHKHFQPPIDFLPELSNNAKSRINDNFSMFVSLISLDCPRDIVYHLNLYGLCGDFARIINSIRISNIREQLDYITSRINLNVPKLFPNSDYYSD